MIEVASLLDSHRAGGKNSKVPLKVTEVQELHASDLSQLVVAMFPVYGACFPDRFAAAGVSASQPRSARCRRGRLGTSLGENPRLTGIEATAARGNGGASTLRQCATLVKGTRQIGCRRAE